MIPGELRVAAGEIELNGGRETIDLTALNTGDRDDPRVDAPGGEAPAPAEQPPGICALAGPGALHRATASSLAAAEAIIDATWAVWSAFTQARAAVATT